LETKYLGLGYLEVKADFFKTLLHIPEDLLTEDLLTEYLLTEYLLTIEKGGRPSRRVSRDHEANVRGGQAR
jgi:hypothetical protein